MMDTSYSLSNPVCADCGLVIGNSDVASLHGSPNCESTSVQQRSWMDYCTVMNATEKRFAQAIGLLEDLTPIFQLTSPQRIATAEIVRDAVQTRVTDGRHNGSIVAAALILAKRKGNTPLSINRVATAASLSQTDLRSAVGVLSEELGVNPPPPEPADYVLSFATELDTPLSVVRDTDQLLTRARSEGLLAGRNPAGVAAAVLYIVSNEGYTQQQLADLAGVSPETIRVRLNELRGLDSDA
ncbi:transcription initiation factor TFIIB [Halorientalis persicus]|uniref:Transcription initiation factor TFIIB n=1 Tax=Halorientalis persicus TaxID=1367881 RepID=A0A1H8W9D7_9EURY|nr:hypothetical protein [Halorientalis persicus]SEP24250.1 transcription initiation factor TFIIB [Halorientalis persicus]